MVGEQWFLFCNGTVASNLTVLLKVSCQVGFVETEICKSQEGRLAESKAQQQLFEGQQFSLPTPAPLFLSCGEQKMENQLQGA